MREKELRLALVCYGGISLAVYMHGITMEIWRLARASRAFHDDSPREHGTQGVYRQLLETIATETGLHLRVLVDIIAGASAGGINGVFLGQAIATGQSLEPLTSLWLDYADVEILVDPGARPFSRISKFWATPIAWWAAGRPGGTLDRTVEAEGRDEVRAKLSRFVRARWFEPPFGGPGFCNLLLDAFAAMAETPAGPPLLPDGQPLDLFVTVTDFHGHPERLKLHSPAEIVETEHRLVIAFSDHAVEPRHLGDIAELVFATRATASFPGAFPPFTVRELDNVLTERNQSWPGRNLFLERILPRHAAIGAVESAVLIDGSVLANAPFRPAIDALRDRPARREVDRRFVYIDPKAGKKSVRIGGERTEVPGFFTTIFGALSDIPREQPIRDNLDTIGIRSARIARMRVIVETIRPEVEAAIEDGFGMTFFLDSPTPARLRSWRAKAQDAAAKRAGFAYASYGHLKLSGVVEDLAESLRLLAGEDHQAIESYRNALWAHIRSLGLIDRDALTAGGASDAVILFLRSHDLGYRIRRLRTVARRIAELEQAPDAPREELRAMADAVYQALAPYLDRQVDDFYSEDFALAARSTIANAQGVLAGLAKARNLKQVDDQADELIAAALAGLPKPERRAVLLAYLGFPFDDIATLPLLQGEGDDEFNEIKVDRIAPDDAIAIREGGAEATLKGIQFNSFGAFFSRAYRENDYLWGRLHGADRLIDIVVSTLPHKTSLSPGTVSQMKKDAFRAILAEERDRLSAIPTLLDTLTKEVG